MDVSHILMQLRDVTGHDFTWYKRRFIEQQIEWRMAQNNSGNVDDYARYLIENPLEAQILFKEFLINVTCFFRDADAFKVLEKEILPKLCEDKTDSDVFRVWAIGCSTGEEAYSIAIILHEYIKQTGQNFKIQIYGTDLDDYAIKIARMGIYPRSISQHVTQERLRRFFIKEKIGYRIKKDIQERIVFSVHNVIKDTPPDVSFDLLICRNLMIYLTPELQQQLILTFHHALKSNGVLFLSPSESIGEHLELFSMLNRSWRFYCAMDIS